MIFASIGLAIMIWSLKLQYQPTKSNKEQLTKNLSRNMKNMLIIQSWVDGQSGLINIQYKIWLNSNIKEAHKKMWFWSLWKII